jgi:hypothetical protein
MGSRRACFAVAFVVLATPGGLLVNTVGHLAQALFPVNPVSGLQLLPA